MNKISLYSCFNKWKKFDAIYIISDTHFGDLDCYMQRFPELFASIPYEEECLANAVKELDEMQIRKINSICGKTSMIIILGDVGSVESIKQLKAAYKVLIMGNHDKGASNYKRYSVTYHYENIIHVSKEKIGTGSFDYIEHLSHEPKLVTDVEDKDNHLFDEVYEGPLQINDKLILSHIPLKPLREYEFNIHGHTHSLPFKYDEQRLNVCAEAIEYKPFNLTKALMKGLLSKLKSNTRIYIDNINKRGSEI